MSHLVRPHMTERWVFLLPVGNASHQRELHRHPEQHSQDCSVAQGLGPAVGQSRMGPRALLCLGLVQLLTQHRPQPWRCRSCEHLREHRMDPAGSVFPHGARGQNLRHTQLGTRHPSTELASSKQQPPPPPELRSRTHEPKAQSRRGNSTAL